jgi:hypothetical protein
MRQSPQALMLVAAGVATACLVFANPVLGDLYYTAGLLIFAFGVIRAIYSEGQRRAFWIGFVILYSLYCYHTTWAFIQYGGGRNMSTGLITTRLLAAVYETMNPELMAARGRVAMPPSPMSLPGNLFGGYIGFLTMGHTLIALGLGVIGGRVAQRFASPPSPTSQRSLEEILQQIDSP